MKPLLRSLAVLCSALVGMCATLEGNGLSLRATLTDPATGAAVEIQTAK